MDIHARALKYFDTIRRCGSIREAARRLHVASSAVNRQLLQLEEEIGAPLFDRMPGGLKLTAAGRLLTELGVYVRVGRTLPPTLDAFIRFVEDELEQRAAQEAAA